MSFVSLLLVVGLGEGVLGDVGFGIEGVFRRRRADWFFLDVVMGGGIW